MKKQMTNIQFVEDLMTHSRHGALSQLFVIEALTKWSDIIANTAPEETGNGLIPGESWVSVAKEIQAKLNAKYGA